MAVGAYDPRGRLLGFVFGITGIRQGRPVHWSHMLAVRKSARGAGLGKRLKAYQRELLLEAGVEVAYWTFDPLEARNANLNINALGAEPVEYVPDMYGDDTGSELHRGLGTDRLVVRWKLGDSRVQTLLAGQGSAPEPSGSEAPVVGAEVIGGMSVPAESELPELPAVRVEIPEDIQRVKAESVELARAWRRTTRRAFLRYLSRGWRVSAFGSYGSPGRWFYLLTRQEE